MRAGAFAMRWIGLAVFTVLLLAPPSRSDEALYGVSAQADVMVPMRDQVSLATDVYLPARDGKPVTEKWPTILMRTPYNKSRAASDAGYFAAHGYAVVMQDTRGRFHSQGIWHMLTDDGRDGFDTCDWIGKQSWSNGKVGTIGTSYVGGTQHALAMERPPQLVTAIPVDAMSNLGYAGMRNGGAFELRFWNWIVSIAGPEGSRQSRDPATAAMLAEMRDHRREYLVNLPLRRGTTPLKHIGEYEDWLVEALGHGINDDFWKQNNILDYTEAYKDMPVYLVGGWYDSWAGNTTANFVALSRKIKGPAYLIMGPWIHGQQGGSSHGQVSFGASAAIADPLAWRLEWYDHWLKGIDNTVGKQAPFATPVRIFVMGTGDGRKTADGLLNHGGSWRDEHEWPLARPRRRRTISATGGRLATRSPARDASTSFRFDPARPGADHRRQHLLRRRHPAARRLGPARRAARLERAGPHPALGPQRRSGVPVGAAGRRPGSHRRDRGEAVGFIVRGRHRLHGQADRRLPGQL